MLFLYFSYDAERLFINPFSSLRSPKYFGLIDCNSFSASAFSFLVITSLSKAFTNINTCACSFAAPSCMPFIASLKAFISSFALLASLPALKNPFCANTVNTPVATDTANPIPAAPVKLPANAFNAPPVLPVSTFNLWKLSSRGLMLF